MKALNNNCVSLWQVLNLEDSVLEKIDNPIDLATNMPPLLFIHGVEFDSVEEAYRDLVHPMISQLGKERLKHRTIYILSWHSLIVPRHVSKTFFAAGPVKKIISGLIELMKCRQYINDVELRAKMAGRYLSPFIVEWNSVAKTGPVVITHSMGSLVWVEALRHLLESSSMMLRPGIWWSLQPAMRRHSFTASGEYKMVSKLYTGHESARAMIWFSRLDFILSSLYVLSTRTFALGQLGCPEQSLPQRDVTSIVGEAHGMSHLTRFGGDFFKRAGDLIVAEASNLGII